MEVLRKLLFNTYLGHNPLHQDSFGPRELVIAKDPTRNKHPLLRGKHKTRYSHRPQSTPGGKPRGRESQEVEPWLNSQSFFFHIMYQQMCQRFSLLKTFISGSAKFVSPSSFPTHMIPAATVSQTAW